MAQSQKKIKLKGRYSDQPKEGVGVGSRFRAQDYQPNQANRQREFLPLKKRNYEQPKHPNIETIIEIMGSDNFTRASRVAGKGNWHSFGVFASHSLTASIDGSQAGTEYIPDDKLDQLVEVGNAKITRQNGQGIPIYFEHRPTSELGAGLPDTREQVGSIYYFYLTRSLSESLMVSALIKFLPSYALQAEGYNAISLETEEDSVDVGGGLNTATNSVVVRIKDVNAAALLQYGTQAIPEAVKQWTVAAGINGARQKVPVALSRARGIAEQGMTFQDLQNLVKQTNAFPSQLYDINHIIGNIEIDDNGITIRKGDRDVTDALKERFKAYKASLVAKHDLTLKAKEAELDSLKQTHKKDMIAPLMEKAIASLPEHEKNWKGIKLKSFDIDGDKNLEANLKNFEEKTSEEWEAVQAMVKAQKPPPPPTTNNDILNKYKLNDPNKPSQGGEAGQGQANTNANPLDALDGFIRNANALV